MFNPVCTDLPQITWLCGLYCVEETTAILVYCDSFLKVTILTFTKTKEVRCNNENNGDCLTKTKTKRNEKNTKLVERLQAEFVVTIYLEHGPE